MADSNTNIADIVEGLLSEAPAVTTEVTAPTVTTTTVTTPHETSQSNQSQPTAAENAIIAHMIRLFAEAVTDMRKGDAVIVAKLTEMSNTIMSLKNKIDVISNSIDNKSRNAKSNVYIVKNVAADEPPTNLFNAKPEEVANCD